MRFSDDSFPAKVSKPQFSISLKNALKYTKPYGMATLVIRSVCYATFEEEN